MKNMKITQLNISYNKQIDSTFYYSWKYIEKLYLRGLGLRQLPGGLKELENLVLFDLAENLLSSIPEEFEFHFKNLQKLNLKNNQISQLNFNFSKLNQLKELNLSHNQLEMIDLYFILKSQSLTSLNVSSNRLIELQFNKSNILCMIYCSFNIRHLKLSNYLIYSNKSIRQFLYEQQILFSKNQFNFNYLPHIMLLGPSNTGKSSFSKWFFARFPESSFSFYSASSSSNSSSHSASTPSVMASSNPAMHAHHHQSHQVIDGRELLNLNNNSTSKDPVSSLNSPTVSHHHPHSNSNSIQYDFIAPTQGLFPLFPLFPFPLPLFPPSFGPSFSSVSFFPFSTSLSPLLPSLLFPSLPFPSLPSIHFFPSQVRFPFCSVSFLPLFYFSSSPPPFLSLHCITAPPVCISLAVLDC